MESLTQSRVSYRNRSVHTVYVTPISRENVRKSEPSRVDYRLIPFTRGPPPRLHSDSLALHERARAAGTQCRATPPTQRALREEKNTRAAYGGRVELCQTRALSLSLFLYTRLGGPSVQRSVRGRCVGSEDSVHAAMTLMTRREIARRSPRGQAEIMGRSRGRSRGRSLGLGLLRARRPGGDPIVVRWLFLCDPLGEASEGHLG